MERSLHYLKIIRPKDLSQIFIRRMHDFDEIENICDPFVIVSGEEINEKEEKAILQMCANSSSLTKVSLNIVGIYSENNLNYTLFPEIIDWEHTIILLKREIFNDISYIETKNHNLSGCSETNNKFCPFYRYLRMHNFYLIPSDSDANSILEKLQKNSEKYRYNLKESDVLNLGEHYCRLNWEKVIPGSTQNIPSTKYLLFATGGGIGNQLLRFHAALELAVLLNRDLVVQDLHIPWEHLDSEHKFPYSVPFTDIFSLDHGSKLKIRLITYQQYIQEIKGFPKEKMMSLYQPSSLVLPENQELFKSIGSPDNMKAFLSNCKYRSISLFSSNFRQTLLSPELSLIVGSLPKLNETLQKKIDHMIETLFHGHAYSSAHFRRGDFKEYCEERCLIYKKSISPHTYSYHPCDFNFFLPDHSQSKLIPRKPILNSSSDVFKKCMQSCWPSDNDFADSLKKYIPSGSWLYLSTNSDDPIKLSRILQQHYPRLSFLPVNQSLNAFETTVADMWICKSSQHFVGNGFSTFSWNIALFRGYDNSSAYNCFS